MVKESKRLASKPSYTSPKQLTLAGFETPFEQQLAESNRWVQLLGFHGITQLNHTNIRKSTKIRIYS
jgi:hypothetical protein